MATRHTGEIARAETLHHTEPRWSTIWCSAISMIAVPLGACETGYFERHADV